MLCVYHALMTKQRETKALSVSTCVRCVGDITSLIFNPHDGNFYGCNETSKSIVTIQGISFIN